MRVPLTELLQRRIVLLDGGMGSSLISRGLASGQCPERWNLERPDEIRAVHATFLQAGCDLIQTNTFGGHPAVLAKHGLDVEMEQINRAGARLAREVAGEGKLVAGNLGPSGILLPPLGDAEPEAVQDGFARQAAALAEGGVDSISVETMMDLEEAVLALRGALSATNLPVTVCLTFDKKKRGFFTMMGNRPEQCVARLAEEGAAAVGANCSIGSDAMLELCAQLVETASLPVILKPNAGLPELLDGRPIYRQDPVEFAAHMAEAVRAGARAVGGCCGTDARFIAALRTALGSALTAAHDDTGPEGSGVGEQERETGGEDRGYEDTGKR